MQDPSSAKLAQELDTFLGRLNTALNNQDVAAVANFFHDESYWRDLIFLTWNIHTSEGHDQIKDMLAQQLSGALPVNIARDEKETVTSNNGVMEAWLTMETKHARGEGHVRIRDGKIWTLLTSAYELKGYEEPLGERRAKGVEHGAFRQRKTWAERRQQEAEELGYKTQPYALIIGGGQGGIGLGARMRQLGIPTIIVERRERAGDSWRHRYKSLCLHDPVWYDHLPYLPFPSNWPIFSPKDKIGDWLECYTKLMELNYWASTECKSARYDENKKEWEVTVVREGQTVVLRPKQLILATGMSGKANIPKFPGQDIFKGEQQHSSQHPGPDAYAGKKVVVVD